MARLSAIVPATNRPPTLGPCVEAIRAALDPHEELIVIESAPAPGPAAARNEGARGATGEVLLGEPVGPPSPPIDPEMRGLLEEFYAPDAAALEQLLGRPVPWAAAVP